MPKKTKVFTPKNIQIIADLRAQKVPAVKIAKALGVSLSALARAVVKHDLPRQKRKIDITPPISPEEMAARPKAQTITERRAVAYVPPKTDAAKVEAYRRDLSKTFRRRVATGGLDRSVSFGTVEKLSRGEIPTAEGTIRVYESPIDMATDSRPGVKVYSLATEFKDWNDEINNRPRNDNPFRLKARISEFNRDRRAILEDIEGEIDKAFRKFRTLAGPNTRIQDGEVFNLLSAEAKAALDHLQALIDAARHLREANGAITEAAIHLHKAGAAVTRPTA